MRILLACLALPSLAFAAAPAEAAQAEKAEKFKLIHVADAVSAQKKGKVYFFDANGPDTRTKEGIVPGATQLSSSHDFDLKVLPADKGAKLVFYCANTH